jgi:hypothetical protein
MSGKLTTVEPVRETVTVPTAPQRTFELFTAHIGEWWPLRATRSRPRRKWPVLGVQTGYPISASEPHPLTGIAPCQ